MFNLNDINNATINFNNGYGISVVKCPVTNLFTLAILHNGRIVEKGGESELVINGLTIGLVYDMAENIKNINSRNTEFSFNLN